MTPQQALLAQSSPALAGLVAERLREMITLGVLAPGERLKEIELAESMQVSRGPVREAIAMLEYDGLVESVRHRGARVIELTAVDIEEVYSLRLAIERLAMQRASLRMTPAVLASMDAVLERMRVLPLSESEGDHVALDLEFHDLVYEAADHSRLLRSWQLIRSQVSIFLHARTDHESFRSSAYDEHVELREVLAGGDPAAATAAVEEHIGWALERLKSLHGGSVSLADPAGAGAGGPGASAVSAIAAAAAGEGPLAGPGPEGKAVLARRSRATP